MSIHETPDAAVHWHEHCRGHLESIGFKQGRATFRAFHRPVEGGRLFVHGGGDVTSGRDFDVNSFARGMGTQHACKTQIFWFDQNDDKHVNALDRLIIAHRKGAVYDQL